MLDLFVLTRMLGMLTIKLSSFMTFPTAFLKFSIYFYFVWEKNCDMRALF